MRKKVFYLFLFLFTGMSAFSQAYEGSIEYDKKKQQAFMIDYNYPPESVEAAIVQKMESMGYKAKEEKGIFNKDKGFIIFKGAFIPDISPSSMDYIVKVERKSRREKDESVIYMIIMKDGNNAKDGFEAEDVSNAKRFLNDLLPNVEASHLEFQIRAQEDVVVKAEKKLKNLQDDKKDMEEKIRKLQDDIKTNEKNQQNTEQEIANQKTALEALKGKRKS
ncbi:MAG TPA: hypothetical protein VFX58_01655 [Chitinophagaceae bacterium]|nr:hypothetical protein [Chitinophagaceae bacterium]